MGGIITDIETNLKPKEAIIDDLMGSRLGGIKRSKWVKGGILVELTRRDEYGNKIYYIRNAHYTSKNWRGERRLCYNDNPLNEQECQNYGLKF